MENSCISDNLYSKSNESQRSSGLNTLQQFIIKCCITGEIHKCKYFG